MKKNKTIYFHGVPIAKEKDFRKFLMSNTTYGYFVSSYFDKNFKKEQCHRARRSFYDLLTIVNTYYPNISVGQLAYFLTTEMRCFLCYTIEKYVFHNVSIMQKDNLYIFNDSRYAKPPSKKDSDGISYNDIVRKANLYAKRNKLKLVKVFQKIK